MGRNYGAALVAALGFTRSTTPCAATLHTVFKYLDIAGFEAKLGAWAEQVLAALPPVTDPVEAVACDGKTLRGSRKLGAPGSHLLAAVSHRLGLTLIQCAVADKTNELSPMHEILTGLLLSGRVITTDALHTQREFAQAVLAAGGDYIMFVKDNQPQWREDIATLFQEPQVVAETLTTARTLELGHGRIEERHLTASWALIGYTDWPGLQQVFQLERTITIKKTGQQRHEVVYGVTSLPAPRAGMPPACSVVPAATGASRLGTGSATSLLTRIAPKSAAVTSPKSWPPCAIPQSPSCAWRARPTSPPPYAAMQPSLGPHWR